ncbi:bifunctional ADP-dependent NAD(P)H-hydrate dehydratase/NAD(P)H-hydrate epimerase [Arthrobacter sp. GMC3]|uniref:bifunctional ADP-dependent NAD(P)H-hydrate dehydratase/NAD(P)H-hydrate epimerase n=1 Tax=Arthrobacter sp. GMC3 TaxID=2058894 RepID=UPI000CE2C1EB|nr:bifunctional ADP-dependent NAD(P)H-hydrate dehydratase/NAD(P)H-hydrate epimerase [Arthrobacter sp. GMC3]
MLRAYTAVAVRVAEQPLLDAGHGPALMRRAAYGLALGVVSVLRSRGQRVYGSRAVLLIGSGNNGGDALYAGAYLASRGVRATALLASERTHPDALAAFIKAGGRSMNMPLPATVPASSPGQAPPSYPARGEGAQQAFLAEADSADVIVDGLLGTGGHGGLQGPVAAVVAQLCEIVAGVDGPAVVACDLPSGVNATTGEVMSPVLPADLTVTFGAAKTGLLTAPAEQLCGTVAVVDIGITEFLGDADVLRLESCDVAKLLPRPVAADHKYTRGVAGIVAGSARYPGAGLLAVSASSACGPGMVRYLGAPEVCAAIHVRNPEVVCSQEFPTNVRVQAWLVGPGIDGDDDALRRAREAMDSGVPTVVDAAALALLGSGRPTEKPEAATGGAGSPHNTQLVLTPHAGELSSLFARHGIAKSRAEIEAAPLAAARLAARVTGSTVLLKGPTTVVAAPSGRVFTQADGAPSLATAGSGDTLAGILVALLAMRAERPHLEGLDGGAADTLAITAALAAVLHGRLAQDDAPLNAGQLAARIPAIWAGLAH